MYLIAREHCSNVCVGATQWKPGRQQQARRWLLIIPAWIPHKILDSSHRTGMWRVYSSFFPHRRHHLHPVEVDACLGPPSRRAYVWLSPSTGSLARVRHRSEKVKQRVSRSRSTLDFSPSSLRVDIFQGSTHPSPSTCLVLCHISNAGTTLQQSDVFRRFFLFDILALRLPNDGSQRKLHHHDRDSTARHPPESALICLFHDWSTAPTMKMICRRTRVEPIAVRSRTYFE